MSNTNLESLFEQLCGKWLAEKDWLSVRGELGVFSYASVVWLGIEQRLKGNSLHLALGALVERFKAGELQFLINRASRKLRERVISLSTGDVSRARDRLSDSLVSELYEEATANIEKRFRELDLERPVYLLDGQVTAIARSKSNLDLFGPTGNGEGELHYPRIRIIAAHKLSTGVATKVAIGNWHDSEVKLSRELFPQLPKGSLLIMDRGFDKPPFLDAAHSAGIDVLVRLKDSKGSKLLQNSSAENDSKVTDWSGKTKDGRLFMLHGQVVKFTSQVKGFRSSIFYFFTTDLSLTAEQVAAFYQKRVKVEVFIRDIKQTLKLSFIRAKKTENVKKEILIAYLTFNFLRAIMYDTAFATNFDVHRLSFSATIALCCAYANSFLNGKQPHHEILAQFRKHMLQAKLPLRKTPRSYPRQIKSPRDKYPSAAVVRPVNTEKGK